MWLDEVVRGKRLKGKDLKPRSLGLNSSNLHSALEVFKITKKYLLRDTFVKIKRNCASDNRSKLVLSTY